MIVNWPEVAGAGLDRLRHQRARAPFDEQLRGLVTLAEKTLIGIPRPPEPSPELVVCPWFRIGDHVVKTIGRWPLGQLLGPLRSPYASR